MKKKICLLMVLSLLSTSAHAMLIRAMRNCISKRPIVLTRSVAPLIALQAPRRSFIKCPTSPCQASHDELKQEENLISLVFLAEAYRHQTKKISLRQHSHKNTLDHFKKLAAAFPKLDEPTKNALLSTDEDEFEQAKLTLYSKALRKPAPWYWPRVATYRGEPASDRIYRG